MSEENVEAVRNSYELWSSGDFGRFLEMVHPDFVFTTSGTFPGIDSEYRGREGMTRFSDTMLDAWATFQIEPTEIRGRDSYVIATLRFLGTGRISGVEVAVDFHHVLHFRDGLVDRLISHPNLADALAIAGLTE